MDDGDAIFDDITQMKVDETDMVESGDNNEYGSQHDDMIDERSINIGINNDTQGRDEYRQQEVIEIQNPDPRIKKAYHYMRRSHRQNAGILPTQFGFEEVIIRVAPKPADDEDIPISYSGTLNRDDASSWIEAMRFELESLRRRNNCTLVPQPDNRKVIQTKWVYE